MNSLHFRVSPNIIGIIRQAYWMENRQEWAKETLRCFDGITEPQMMDLLKGNAYFVTHDDGETLELVKSPDFEWKAELQKFLKWQENECVYVGGKAISKDLYDLYFKNLRRMWVWSARGQERFAKIEQRFLNDIYQEMREQAGFKFSVTGEAPIKYPNYGSNKHIALDTPDYIVKGLDAFEKAFKLSVKIKIDQWEKDESIFIKPEVQENLLLTPDLEKAISLHNEIVAICFGGNTRKDLKVEESALQIFDEIVALCKKYESLLSERSYAKRLLEKSALDRRLIHDCMDWGALDFARATIHSLTVSDNSHGKIWKEKNEKD